MPDLRRSVHPHPSLALEVDEEKAHVMRRGNVAHGEIHAISVVVGKGEGLVIDHGHEARVSSLVGAGRLSCGIDGCEKEHVEAFDEGPVFTSEAVMDRHLLETVGEAAGIEAILQLASGGRIKGRHGRSWGWVGLMHARGDSFAQRSIMTRRSHTACPTCRTPWSNQYVGVEDIDDGLWTIFFNGFLLATSDERDYTITG